jgi:NAD+ kinase
MTKSSTDPNDRTFARVGLVAKTGQGSIGDEITHIIAWLEKRDVEVVLDETAGELAGDAAQICDRSDLPAQVDLVIALGGDGTLLSVARFAAEAATPVLGINYGNLGFLTLTPREEIYEVLEQVFTGQFTSSSRMMLRASIERADGSIVTWDVLNDAVVNKTSLARIIEYEVSVDDEFVSRYRADGLIVATPTGSTAYSLSAGGPLIMPEMDAVVVCPISPHSLANRPLVLPGDTHIAVNLITSDQDIVLTLDGQEGARFDHREVTKIERCPHRFELLSAGERAHFEVLRTKLGWGVDRK